MKRGSFLLVAAFVLGLTSLVALSKTGYTDQIQVKALDEEPCDEAFCLKKRKAGSIWHLSYRFKGLNDQIHEVACDINEADAGNLIKSFGYHESNRARLLVEYQETAINVAAQKALFFLGFGKVYVSGDVVDWVPSQALSEVEQPLFATERSGFFNWYLENKRYDQLFALAKNKFLADYGLMSTSELGEIPDYDAMVSKSTQALSKCIDALDSETGGRPEILQIFFQSMFFNKIALQEGGKWTGGLSLPPRVMIQGRGDCDSKAVAFCTIQRKREPRLVILRSLPGDGSPRHVLVGVEAWTEDSSKANEAWPYKSVPEALRATLYEKPIRIGLREYWPCEVAGRRRIAFGQVAVGHEGKYVALRIQ